jgi:hypothetical protein
MIMREDIHPDWSPDDVALFAAIVGAVQEAVRETTEKFGRNDPVLRIVGKGTLVALKGLLLEVGMRQQRSSIGAFGAYVQMLNEEAAEAPEQCKAFEATMTYHGRA